MSLAALLLLPLLAAPDDGSLEAYLEVVRHAREAERLRLAPRVEELAKRLGTARADSEAERIASELTGLGSEAMPLLVPYLDPGAPDASEAIRRAQRVAAILVDAHDPALLEPLLALARRASPEGRRNALHVLGFTPETELALAGLRELYPELTGVLRAECLGSLARLAPGDARVLEALADPAPEVVGAALVALTGEALKKPRPEVLALLEDGPRAVAVLDPLTAYLATPGQVLDEEIVTTLVRYAARTDLAPGPRLNLLEALPRLGVPLSSRLRKEFEPLLSSSDSAIKDGALVALTLLRDSRARRELMRFYDDQVDDNSGWPLAYQRRGDIEFKIGEFRDAARDYARALELHADSARLPGNRDLWINLARAYIKDNKLKAAADALEQFGLTAELRRTLREDPDFQPLVEHSRYKSLFE